MKTKRGEGTGNAAKPVCVGIIGLGYVGLPLGAAFARSGLPVLGFDLDARKVADINAGRSYIKHIPSMEVKALLRHGGRATTNPIDLAEADAVLICVPTPLTKNRDPDMSFVEGAADMLSAVVRKGQLICLESTTYPGTTREVVLPRLEKSGLIAGRDFHLAYSPEREDPGSQDHSANAIPKVVGDLTPKCLETARRLYDRIAPRTIPVSSLETAEATKLMENIFRCVNIALVNELKQVFAHMGLDIWEVVEAASSKPFGYMPFYPGPGLGGHCIPIDPFYLAWKAREYESATRFIELAGEVNVSMPEYVVGRTVEELNRERKSLNGSRVLIIGLAYKPDVDDVRESPSLRLIELYSRNGCLVDYHDPYIPAMHSMRSIDLTTTSLAKYDAVVIATHHSDIDYALVGRVARLVIDTRNVMAKVKKPKARVAKA
ncbi:MAG: nucleotide sugar dehydrogenase [Planctomycetota bacterium]|jgi:UDP-N-acetyl-D-glucosamine dehydrogenase|nr:nucleotide sugar dehydrogenase [Planctomycetota bacterium]